MAEAALGFAVSTVAERLSRVLIHESTVLTGVVRQVEWIERELRLMHAFLEHVQHHGEDEEGFNKWATELEDVARDAGDVIETFVIKSVKRRRIGLVYWSDRYKVAKQLQQIIQRIRDIAQRRVNYEVAVTVETPGVEGESSSSPTRIVATAVEKLDIILTQNLITSDGVNETVEQVKVKLGAMQDIVSDVNQTAGEIEMEWLKEVKEVCDNTVHVAASFIARRERYSNKGWLQQVLSPSERKSASETELNVEMNHVRTQIGDAIHRSITYGVAGGEVKDMADKIVSRSNSFLYLSLDRLIIAELPASIFNLFLCFYGEGKLAFVLYTIALNVDAWIFRAADPVDDERKAKLTWPAEIRDKWFKRFALAAFLYVLIQILVTILTGAIPQAVGIFIFFFLFSLVLTSVFWYAYLLCSEDRNLKSTQRDLALIRALLSDIESSQGLILNERQKVWVKQLTMVAQYGRSLVDARGMGGRCFNRIKFPNDINSLLTEIHNISERKIIYGIPSIQATTTRERASRIQITVDQHNDDVAIYRPSKGLEKKVQSIREEMELMAALFRDVEEFGELDGRSTIWVEQMRRIASETQSVLDDYAAIFEHRPIHVHILNYPSRTALKRKISQIISKLQDASRRRKTYGLMQFQRRSMVQVLRRKKQPSLVAKESSIVGMDEDVQVLMHQLLTDDERRCIITLVGIGGIGKKTLARLVFDNNAVMDHFDCRIWVSVSPNCDIAEEVDKQIMSSNCDIAEEVVKQIMESSQPQETGRTEKVLQTLASKRYLLVVEGLVDSKVLDTLENTIPDMSTASRILLTSGNASVEQRPGTRTFVHPLQLLDDQDSWVLFRRNLKLEVDYIPQEVIKVGKEIVIKCGGLPSEILKMSHLGSNKGVTYEEWSSVLQQLNQDQKPWLETLKTVNMSLPLYLRKCLFYFLLFPADYRIPARRLVVLWVAEGLVHHVEEGVPPEEVAERYLAELIDRNMVQIAKRKPNGKVKTCRIPNALRELWLAKANNNDSDNKSIIRQVADCLDEKDTWHDHIHKYDTSASASLRSYYKDVLSFLSFDAREGNQPGQEIGNFLKRCISSGCFLQLRVLDLERVYRPKLAKSIAGLSKLRYLGLRWTYLQSLPSSISSMLKLQTLDLKHTYINILTSSIWKMELRHLFLSETYGTKFPRQPKGISHSLSDLQTLWGLFVDEKTPVKGGLDRLVNIRKLGVACQSMSSQLEEMESQLEAVADWIMKLEHLQSLRLKSRDEEGRPWNLYLKSLENHTYLSEVYLLGRMSSSSVLSHFPPSLVELTLSHSKLEDDPMQILKDLPNLRSLCLLAESFMGNGLVCKAQGFPQLHVLKFWMLEQLEEWIIEEEALPCLRQLEIRSCLCLKMLPDGLKLVSSLLELKLTDMPIEFNTEEHNIPPNCQVFKENSL